MVEKCVVDDKKDVKHYNNLKNLYYLKYARDGFRCKKESNSSPTSSQL